MVQPAMVQADTTVQEYVSAEAVQAETDAYSAELTSGMDSENAVLDFGTDSENAELTSGSASAEEAKATEDAIQYETDLIRKAEEEGTEGLIYATLDGTEAETGAAADDTDTEVITGSDEQQAEFCDTETEVIAELDTAKKAPSKKTVTLYSAKDRYWAGKTKQIKNKNALCVVKGKVTKLKSRNRAVAELLTSTSRGYTTIYVKPKKAGTTVVSFKQGNKTYKTKITVKKYVNPVQQVKIGTTVQNGAKLASSSILKVSCGKNLGKRTPVSVSLSSGWSLSSMTYTQKGAQVGASMKNGDSILLQKGLVVNATVKNKALKQTEEITIRFK